MPTTKLQCLLALRESLQVHNELSAEEFAQVLGVSNATARKSLRWLNESSILTLSKRPNERGLPKHFFSYADGGQEMLEQAIKEHQGFTPGEGTPRSKLTPGLSRITQKRVLEMLLDQLGEDGTASLDITELMETTNRTRAAIKSNLVALEKQEILQLTITGDICELSWGRLGAEGAHHYLQALRECEQE